ncbi:hypothetical protein ELI_15030 [Erythrobacter litoralis HTCC2594]|uniref:Uncharacterized protein n=1 Tax=Erythrobacter litoralis (strain HTCC2594) TaxID=314225 RepID=Q2N5E3_ERYLH|nr:hypothetical protein ELI_15030 [Erythrobacter litoralis HTCC2594]
MAVCCGIGVDDSKLLTAAIVKIAGPWGVIDMKLGPSIEVLLCDLFNRFRVGAGINVATISVQENAKELPPTMSRSGALSVRVL